jgi:hypothetical protein
MSSRSNGGDEAGVERGHDLVGGLVAGVLEVLQLGRERDPFGRRGVDQPDQHLRRLHQVRGRGGEEVVEAGVAWGHPHGEILPGAGAAGR